MAENERVQNIENMVIKIVGIAIGLMISISTYLIQGKISDMSESMKSIEKTVNAIQLQQVGFQKDVEYLRAEQANMTERIKRLERR